MQGPVHAFEFLDIDGCPPLPCLTVLHGDEPFLKRIVLKKIQGAMGTDGDLSFSSRDGADLRWAEVLDEVSTRSLFGDAPRTVIIRQADSFVTINREQLEDYVAASKGSAQIVLEVKSWPANTRLAKAVAKKGLAIACRAPERKAGRRATVDVQRLAAWIAQRAANHHGLEVSHQQVQQVIELVGDNLGVIDNELAKLALFADDAGRLAPETIQTVVGGWRMQTTWVLLDAACSGDARQALVHLDRLIQSGEHSQALFGAFSWSLRRFAAAVRIVQMQEQTGQRRDLSAALVEAGVSQFPRDRFQAAEQSLRQIGRARGDRLYRTLLKSDLKLKGSHSMPERARLVLEEIIFELSATLPEMAEVVTG